MGKAGDFFDEAALPEVSFGAFEQRSVFDTFTRVNVDGGVGGVRDVVAEGCVGICARVEPICGGQSDVAPGALSGFAAAPVSVWLLL